MFHSPSYEVLNIVQLSMVRLQTLTTIELQGLKYAKPQKILPCPNYRQEDQENEIVVEHDK